MAIFDSYVSLPEGTPQPINSEFRLCFAFAEIFMKRGPLRKSRWAAIKRLCFVFKYTSGQLVHFSSESSTRKTTFWML